VDGRGDGETYQVDSFSWGTGVCCSKSDLSPALFVSENWPIEPIGLAYRFALLKLLVQ
jgi:hypothetical protein